MYLLCIIKGTEWGGGSLKMFQKILATTLSVTLMPLSLFKSACIDAITSSNHNAALVKSGHNFIRHFWSIVWLTVGNLAVTISTNNDVDTTNRKPKSNIVKVAVECLACDSRLNRGIKVFCVHCNYCIHSHQIHAYSTLSSTHTQPSFTYAQSICQHIQPFSLYTVSLKKNKQNYFCYNYVKIPPKLIIFGTKMAKNLKLYEVHSFSTSPNSYQCTTLLIADVPNCHITLLVSHCSQLHHQFDRRCHMI